LFGIAAGSPGYSSGDRDLPGWQPSCVNNCSEEEALLPGKIGGYAWLAASHSTIVRKSSPAAQAYLLRLNNCSGRFPGGCAKKKEQENQDPLFLLFQ